MGALSGTITAIDTTAGTITVTPTSGTATKVTLTTSTVLTGLQTTTAASIAVGDRLDLTGVPVTVQAATITVNHSAAATATTMTTMTNTANAPADAPAPGTLRFGATVTALSPPTVQIDNGPSLTLALTSDTTYTEIVTLTASQFAVGQTVRVSLAPGSSTSTASRVDVIATKS